MRLLTLTGGTVRGRGLHSKWSKRHPRTFVVAVDVVIDGWEL